MKANVYRCLHEHKDQWSVKSREPDEYGRVVDHANGVLMADVSFCVQEAGRRRCLEEGQKNVHAMARGRVLYTADWMPERMFASRHERLPVQYRPEWGEFRDARRQWKSVSSAERVFFRPNGECITINPTTHLP